MHKEPEVFFRSHENNVAGARKGYSPARESMYSSRRVMIQFSEQLHTAVIFNDSK
jgi:hypothetical protein